MNANPQSIHAIKSKPIDECVTMEVPPLTSAVERLDDSLEKLDYTVSLLAERLGPVLSPIPSGARDQCSEGIAASPLTNRICHAQARVAMIENNLRELTDALEI